MHKCCSHRSWTQNFHTKIVTYVFQLCCPSITTPFPNFPIPMLFNGCFITFIWNCSDLSKNPSHINPGPSFKFLSCVKRGSLLCPPTFMKYNGESSPMYISLSLRRSEFNTWLRLESEPFWRASCTFNFFESQILCFYVYCTASKPRKRKELLLDDIFWYIHLL